MLFLYYFNWAGTPEELSEFVGRMNVIIKEMEGVEFTGIFIPSSEWHYVVIMKTTNYDKTLQVMKTYIQEFGWTKTSLAKAELLHTFEELGLKE